MRIFKPVLGLLLLLGLYGFAQAQVPPVNGPQLPFLNITAPNQVDGVNVNPNIPAPGNFTSLTAQSVNFTSSVQSFAPVSTNIFANPLMEGTFTSLSVASVNAAGGATILAGAPGRTIFPTGGLDILASGTASGATSENVLCSPSLRSVATFKIAALVTSVPVNAFASPGSITPGPAITDGCAPGDSLIVSNVGSNLATTTNLFLNVPYFLQ